MTTKGGKPDGGDAAVGVGEGEGGEEGRVLIEGNIGRSHITMGIKKVHSVADNMHL